MARRPAKTPARRATTEDHFQAVVLKAAADALIERIKPILAEQPHRPLRTLKRPEIEAMAVDVIAAYVRARATLEDIESELALPLEDVLI